MLVASVFLFSTSSAQTVFGSIIPFNDAEGNSTRVVSNSCVDSMLSKAKALSSADQIFDVKNSFPFLTRNRVAINLLNKVEKNISDTFYDILGYTGIDRCDIFINRYLIADDLSDLSTRITNRNGLPAYGEWLGMVENLTKIVSCNALIGSFFNYNFDCFSAIENSLDMYVIDYPQNKDLVNQIKKSVQYFSDTVLMVIRNAVVSISLSTSDYTNSFITKFTTNSTTSSTATSSAGSTAISITSSAIDYTSTTDLTTSSTTNFITDFPASSFFRSTISSTFGFFTQFIISSTTSSIDSSSSYTTHVTASSSAVSWIDVTTSFSTESTTRSTTASNSSNFVSLNSYSSASHIIYSSTIFQPH